ncbi:PilZ domain-containing protein [Sphingomonas sp. DT-51]|uniref:PilZ domain-containing protein n=1 Tax=Sphingomonas sp. DT-51 TaxID=3396165 RepID=UPI003F1B484A
MSGHDDESRAPGAQADKRRDLRGRDDVAMSARLRLAGQVDGFDVSVRNVSAGGLMAELPHPMVPDSAVEIELAGLGWVAGRIAWQIERRAGIAFDELIDPAALLHH